MSTSAVGLQYGQVHTVANDFVDGSIIPIEHHLTRLHGKKENWPNSRANRLRKAHLT